jgi:hypothetical protein
MNQKHLFLTCCLALLPLSLLLSGSQRGGMAASRSAPTTLAEFEQELEQLR